MDTLTAVVQEPTWIFWGDTAIIKTYIPSTFRVFEGRDHHVNVSCLYRIMNLH